MGAVTLAGSTFAAEARAAGLSWAAPDDCQRADAVSAQVESLIGRPFASVEAPNFEVTITRAGERFRLELVTVDAGQGTRSRRTFEENECVSVTDAAGVAMAIAIGAQADGQPENQEPSVESRNEQPLPQTVPSPVAEKPRAPPTEAKARRRVQIVLNAGAALDAGALPHPAPGFAASAGARLLAFRVELQGLAFLPAGADAPSGGSAEFALFGGAALVCYEAANALGSAAVGACAGFELGRMTGEGSGVTDPGEGDAAWRAARAEIGAVYPASRTLGFAARLGVAVPTSRARFDLAGNEVHRPAALTLRATLGIELWP